MAAGHNQHNRNPSDPLGRKKGNGANHAGTNESCAGVAALVHADDLHDPLCRKFDRDDHCRQNRKRRHDRPDGLVDRY